MYDKMKKDLKALLKIRSDLIVKAIESFSLSGYESYITCYTEGIRDLPSHLYQEQLVTLNVSVNAVGKFVVLEEYIHIQVSFSNRVHDIFIPFLGIVRVAAIEDEKTIIAFEPNNGFATNIDLSQRYTDHCKNGERKTEEQENLKENIVGTNLCAEVVLPISPQASKSVPHLKRVK